MSAMNPGGRRGPCTNGTLARGRYVFASVASQHVRGNLNKFFRYSWAVSL